MTPNLSLCAGISENFAHKLRFGLHREPAVACRLNCMLFLGSEALAARQVNR